MGQDDIGVGLAQLDELVYIPWEVGDLTPIPERKRNASDVATPQNESPVEVSGSGVIFTAGTRQGMSYVVQARIGAYALSLLDSEEELDVAQRRVERCELVQPWSGIIVQSREARAFRDGGRNRDDGICKPSPRLYYPVVLGREHTACSG
ncbi:hypothetical protein N658DRAFT_496026 [Parathielavia hyrcaniae]|uniref:Uncharacterized protein n=1 Tax=Parathielavia hyrcaniae TaxID=113614 RepID=A0AAN6Q150_9PEZI|nr:hypothetical protein N658DRAFT_496026 [Parathielavia hyrcaniae]